MTGVTVGAMTPLHIVMIGVSAHGHMNPHLPVLAELVARGHRVDVTTPAGFAPAVAGTGATVVPVTSVLPDEERGETWPAPDRRVLLVSLGSAYSAPAAF